jgi:hypothetical protein
MSVFSMISFDNCKINLKTPWAAGCCGPKLTIIFLFIPLDFKEFQLKKKLKLIKFFTQ